MNKKVKCKICKEEYKTLMFARADALGFCWNCLTRKKDDE